MAKQVFDVSASSSMSRGQSTEHLRNYKVTDPDAKKYGFYDPTRVHLNFEVTKGGVITPVNKSYHIDKRFSDNLKARNIQIPKPYKMKDGTERERRCLSNIILGGSRAQMIKLAFGDQNVDLSKGADNSNVTRKEDIEKWAIDQYNLMCKLYGEENIVAFVVHLDEKNPHVHCSVVPVVDGKISYNKVFGQNKDESREIFWNTHDAIAKVNAKWGLERGDNINITHAKHRTTEEYLLWLRESCNELEQKKNGLQGELSGLQQSLKLLEGEIRKNEIKVKGLTTMINNKMTVLHDLEQEQEQAEASLLTSEYNKQEVERQRKNLETQIASSQDFLDKKRKELDETKELLELLKKQHEEKQKNFNDMVNNMRKEIRHLKQDEYQNSMGRVYKSLVPILVEKLNRHFEQLINKTGKFLPLNMRSIFENNIKESDLFCFAQSPEEITNTILQTFLGGKDEAGAELLVSGGGGGSNNDGWRKRDDEDEDAYLNRCITMAFKFYKKSKGLARK